MANKFFKITARNEWHDLLGKVLFKTFFHSAPWEDFLEKQLKWLKFERYAYSDKALLSMARVGDKLISHPFCEYGGPLPLVGNIDGGKFRNDLLSEFKDKVRVTFHPELLKYFLGTAETSPSVRVSYFLEGPPDLRKTTRHEIEKAQNNHLEIRKCEGDKDLRGFYGLHLRNARKHRIPAYPLSFFKYFIDSPDSEIILARKNNLVIAGSVFLFYDKFLHYFQNASDERYKNLGANHLILWEQINKHRDEIFDLGGTRIGSPLRVFKQGWGGKERDIIEIKNYNEDGLRDSKLRKAFGYLPLSWIERFSPRLLKYKL